jgi:ketosteroid isomerase-like protein
MPPGQCKLKTICPVVMLTLWSGLMAVGCNLRTVHAPTDTRAADEAAIRRLDADWVKAAQTKQVDAWMAFYSDDAAVLPPNEPTATSKESIRKDIGELLGLPGVSVSWEPTKVEVSKSGDLAYLYGIYDLSMTGPKGEPVIDHGKIAEIWKKQADGGWRCVVDTWSSDLPVAGAPQ